MKITIDIPTKLIAQLKVVTDEDSNEVAVFAAINFTLDNY